MVQDSSPSSPVDVAFEELFEGKPQTAGRRTRKLCELASINLLSKLLNSLKGGHAKRASISQQSQDYFKGKETQKVNSLHENFIALDKQ